MEGYDLVMEEGDYEVAAGAINMEDITSDEDNQDILRRLKENDPDFEMLWVMDEPINDNDYCPEGDSEPGWLGYFIGKSTTLKNLFLGSDECYVLLRPSAVG